MKYYSTSDVGIWILYKDNNDGSAYFYEDCDYNSMKFAMKPEYRTYKFWWINMKVW